MEAEDEGNDIIPASVPMGSEEEEDEVIPTLVPMEVVEGENTCPEEKAYEEAATLLQKGILLKCSQYDNEFSSRNKLFKHLKSTGHSIPVDMEGMESLANSSMGEHPTRNGVESHTIGSMKEHQDQEEVGNLAISSVGEHQDKAGVGNLTISSVGEHLDKDRVESLASIPTPIPIKL